ncbi:MAG TPA: glycosyltransferase family A protein [Methylomirabilota bacterium]|nr:glycosyltransferase family A protein [Methylomirabilota bacterium]
MSTHAADVSVIVPTQACRARASSLVRAIDSVVSQQNARGIPLVVVNGDRGAPEMLEHLRRRADIRLAVLEEAGLPRALHAGRTLVDTPYFAVLDDDDELLPEALQTRLAALDAAPGTDVAVTNGYLVGFGRHALNIGDFGRIRADPLRMLLVQNWLAPCAGLYRTGAVTTEFFADVPEYREWTYLALRLARALRITFTDRPTFVYRTDTPGSLSKSREYCLAGPSATARMLALDLPPDVRAALRVRLARDLNDAAACELAAGNYRAAWRWHLASLLQPSGWRHLPYACHLLRGALAPLFAARRPGPSAP